MPELVEELIFVFRGQDGGLQQALRSREADLRRLKTVAEQITAELGRSDSSALSLSQSISGADFSPALSQLTPEPSSDAGSGVDVAGQDTIEVDAQVEALSGLVEAVAEAQEAGRTFEASLDGTAEGAEQATEELREAKEAGDDLGETLEDLEQDVDIDVDTDSIREAQAAFREAVSSGQAALDAFFQTSLDLASGLAAAQTSLRLVAGSDEAVADITGRLRGLSEELRFLVGTGELVALSSDVVANGFDDAADAATVLRAAVQGAIASESDNAQFSSTLGATLAAFELGAEDAQLLADQLVTLRDVGRLEIDATFSGNFGRLAAAANAANVEITDLFAAVATSSTVIDANLALTGFNQALAAIQRGGASAQAREVIDELTAAAEELGLEFAGFNTQALEDVGFTGLIAQIEELSAATGTELGENLLALTGSTNAQAALLTLTGEGAARATEAIEDFNNAAGASETNFEITSVGFDAEIQRIQGIIKTFQTAVGTDLQAALTPLLTFLGDVLENILEIPAPLRSAATQILFFGSAALTAAGAINTFRGSLPLVLRGLGIYTQTMGQAVPLAGRFTAGLRGIAPQATLAAAAILSVRAAADRFRDGGESVRDAADEIRESLAAVKEEADGTGDAIADALAPSQEINASSGGPIDFVVNGLNELGEFQRDTTVRTIRAGVELTGLDQIDAVSDGLDSLQEQSDNFRITTFGDKLASDALIALEDIDGAISAVATEVRIQLDSDSEAEVQQGIANVAASLQQLDQLQSRDEFSEERLGTQAFAQFTRQIEISRDELQRYQEQLESNTQASIIEESVAAQTLLQDALEQTADIVSQGGTESTEQAQVRVAAAESAAESILRIEERLSAEREAFSTGQGSTEERAASQGRIQALEDELEETTRLSEQLTRAAAGELSDAEVDALVTVDLDAEVDSEAAEDAIKDAIASITTETQTVELDIELRESQAELASVRQGGTEEQQQARQFALEQEFAQERIALQQQTIQQLRELEESSGSEEVTNERLQAEAELNRQLIAQETARQDETKRIREEEISETREAQERAAEELNQQESQAELDSLDQGGTEAEQAAREFEIAQGFAQRRIELQRTTIEELRALEQSGGGEAATEDRVAAEQALAQQQIDLKRQEIEERNRLEAEAVREVERTQQLALDEVRAAETERNLLITERELQLRQQGISQAEIERTIAAESLQARRESLQEQLRVQEQFISDLASLPQDEDNEDRIRAAKEETNRIALDLVQTEIDAQEQLTQRVIDGIEREQQRRQTAADAALASIERQQSLASAQSGLQDAIATAGESSLRNDAAEAEGDERLRIEIELAQLQQRNLATRQQAEAQALAFAQRRAQVEAEIALAQSRAELARGQARGATAEELDALQLVVDLNQQQLSDLAQIQAIEQQTLRVQQESAQESAESAVTQAQQALARFQEQERERAESESSSEGSSQGTQAARERQERIRRNEAVERQSFSTTGANETSGLTLERIDEFGEVIAEALSQQETEDEATESATVTTQLEQSETFNTLGDAIVAEIEAQRRAQVEAEIALAQSRAELARGQARGATAEELDALQLVVDLNQQQLSAPLVEQAETFSTLGDAIVAAIEAQTTAQVEAIENIPRPKPFFRGTSGKAATPVGDGFTVAERGPEIATDPITGKSQLFNRETYLSSDTPLIVHNAADTQKLLTQDTVNNWVAQQRAANASSLVVTPAASNQAGQIAIAAHRSPGGGGGGNVQNDALHRDTIREMRALRNDVRQVFRATDATARGVLSAVAGIEMMPQALDGANRKTQAQMREVVRRSRAY